MTTPIEDARKALAAADRRRAKRRTERRARGRRRRELARQWFYAPLIAAQELARKKPK